MDTTAISQAVARAHARGLACTDGEVATYIPQLAAVDAEAFSVGVCAADGEVSIAGDDHHLFTLQSCCKPFLYAAALSEFGRDAVHRLVGVEPTGQPFNSFIRIESHTHRPHNPMINAGAIAVSALLARTHGTTWLLELFSRYMGRPAAQVDMPVYLSEKSSAHQNRAVAFLLRYFDGLAAPVDDALDFYFQACSIQVTTRDLMMMAGTLANRGVHPGSHEALLDGECLRDVLTVMTTCGMYDGSGRFAFDVGLPGKSGVSGGVLAVAPGRLAVAAFSPRLDHRGNSVRGVAAVRSVARDLGLHLFGSAGAAPSPPPEPTGRVAAAIETCFEACRGIDTGTVASYTEELATIDPDLFSVAICSVDGTEQAAGDVDVRFSLQAAANPFTYAMALEHAGIDAVHARVGVEPSGNPFNAVVFEPTSGRPYNPLGNGGAIAIASLLPGSSGADRLGHLLSSMGALAATDRLPVDAAIAAAERHSGDRNRAIAHLLRGTGVIDAVDPALDLYFQQCAVLVTIGELARMGATLAGRGRNPLTGAQVLAPDHVRCVLSVMYLCGMHDESGRFAFDVGMPSKSGVSGAIVAVVPGRYGIAVYSPRVGQSGTSVRGAALLQKLARTLRGGVFDS